MTESSRVRRGPTPDAALAAPANAPAEALLKAIFAISSDAIISIDEEQRIVHFNPGAEQIFGWTAHEVVGKPLDVLLPERFRAVHRQHVRRFGAGPVAARRMGERQEISGLRRNGEEFPADASISRLDVGGGRLYSVVLRDITERKRAERMQRFLAEAGALLSSSLELEATLASVARLGVQFFSDYCILFERRPDGRIRRLEAAHRDPTITSRVARLRGHLLDRSLKHPVIDVIDSEQPLLVAELKEEVLSAQAVDHDHMRILGTLVGGSAIFVPMKVLGEGLGAIGFYRGRAEAPYDQDDLIVAQELALRAALALHNARLYTEARDALQARDDVLAVVSHDLGNPLSAIRIGVSLLLRSVPPEERTGGWQHLESIRHSVEHMERLINDLLEIKRIEAGHLQLEWEHHAPCDLVAEALEMMAPLARSREQVLAVDVPRTLPAVRADRDRMRQVLSNLVGNAVKFTSPGGRITIEVRAEGDSVVFSISDSGRGIEPEHLPHVFDRFWQAHRRHREGIGLGLAIVKGIVQAHGGRVWAASRPGEGSSFSFSLPATVSERESRQFSSTE